MNKFKYKYFFFILKIILINNFLFQNNLLFIAKPKTSKKKRFPRKKKNNFNSLKSKRRINKLQEERINQILNYCIRFSLIVIEFFVSFIILYKLFFINNINNDIVQIALNEPIKIVHPNIPNKQITSFFPMNNNNINLNINEQEKNDIIKSLTELKDGIDARTIKPSIKIVDDIYLLFQSLKENKELEQSQDLKFFIENFFYLFQYNYFGSCNDQFLSNNIYVLFFSSLNIYQIFKYQKTDYTKDFLESLSENVSTINSIIINLQTNKNIINPIITQINNNIQKTHDLFFENLLTIIKIIKLKKIYNLYIDYPYAVQKNFRNNLCFLYNYYGLNEMYFFQKMLNKTLNEILNELPNHSIVTIEKKDIYDEIYRQKMKLEIQDIEDNKVTNITNNIIKNYVFYEYKSPVNLLKDISHNTVILTNILFSLL